MKKEIDKDTFKLLLDITKLFHQVFEYVGDLNWYKDEEDITSALSHITMARYHILNIAKKRSKLLHEFLSNS